MLFLKGRNEQIRTDTIKFQVIHIQDKQHGLQRMMISVVNNYMECSGGATIK